MADDIHHHDHIIREPADRSEAMGFLLGIIILAIFLFILLFYGLPFLRNTTSRPQSNVPSNININLMQQK